MRQESLWWDGEPFTGKGPLQFTKSARFSILKQVELAAVRACNIPDARRPA